MRKYYILLVIFLFAGCTKEIEFKGEETKSEIVLNARAVPGVRLKTSVTTSQFFQKPSSERTYISALDTLSGTVTVSVGADRYVMVLDTLQQDKRVLEYVCDYVPAEGDNISVEASFPGFDIVKGETTVPRKVDFSVISAVVEPVEEYFYNNIEVEIRLKDDGSYSKYYALVPELYMIKDGERMYFGELNFKSSDMVFKENSTEGFLGILDQNDVSPYFSDALIRGKEHDIKFTILYVPDAGSMEAESMEVVLTMKTLTESYYHYVTSYSRVLSSSIGLQLFQEPSVLYSNVDGGIGCVCASVSVTKEIK